MKGLFFLFVFILMCFNGRAQSILSENFNKHLIIYRTDVNNFSIYKFMVSNQKFKIGILSLNAMAIVGFLNNLQLLMKLKLLKFNPIKLNLKNYSFA